jgi:hypothetical protein
MKPFLWLLTLALVIECSAVGLLARFIMRSLADTHTEPPMFTNWFFGHPALWLLVPVPWLISAVRLSRRPATGADAVLLFAGTLVVAAASVAAVMLIAVILPLLTFKA